eukprot:TRINITY_DN15639_c0_g1_i1.p2 TRINITY_DN15639_c0_g1~~TRINITY_DN15639_c0_g1_i1.p2  ORF type:complete len:426 (+),score=153.64 TRINITY_DN15639_c0_g1_i1:45-1322(+)
MALDDAEHYYYKYRGGRDGGLKHGHGVLELWDGTRYEGAFVNGEITGRGTKTYPDGASYEGDFLNGEFHGHGLFYSAVTGERYEGEWVQNRAEGLGTLHLPRQKLEYTGGFAGHRMTGMGKLTLQDTMVWEGSFVDGQLEGESCCVRSLEDDVVYEGGMAGSMRHGFGVLARGGVRWEGEWAEDELVDIPGAPLMSPATTSVAPAEDRPAPTRLQEYTAREFQVGVQGLSIAADTGEAKATTLREEHAPPNAASGLTWKVGKYDGLVVTVSRARHPMATGLRLSLHRSDAQRMSVAAVRRSTAAGKMSACIPTPASRSLTPAGSPADPAVAEGAANMMFVDSDSDEAAHTATIYFPTDMKPGMYVVRVSDASYYPMIYPPSPLAALDTGGVRPEGPVQKPLAIPTLLAFDPPKVKDYMIVIDIKK